MKEYIVYLYRAPDCIRGWLAYLNPHNPARYTFKIRMEATTGAKAKNAAIIGANNDFKDLRVIGKNYADPVWGIKNFPELHKYWGLPDF